MPNELFNEEKSTTNCPEDYHCVVSSSGGGVDGNLTGHCCPLQNFQCPVGQPLENVSCNALSSSSDQQYCPLKSHYCYYLRNKGFLQRTLCCPKACHLELIDVDGLCYQPKSANEPCIIDKQCTFNGKCVKGMYKN